jgi:hypothetical protein
MVTQNRMRSRLEDGRNFIMGEYRARRGDVLLRTFTDLPSMSVIDLGGRVETWLRSPVRPASIDIVNLEKPPGEAPDWIRVVQGNACALPTKVTKRKYDLVFSNSVIEHLGGHELRLRFADNVHQLSLRHWIQTPYRYFPIEPHWIFPGFQFFPLNIRAAIARRWFLVPRQPSREECLREVMEIELQSKTAMRAYFPNSALVLERTLGLVKSLIAVKVG